MNREGKKKYHSPLEREENQGGALVSKEGLRQDVEQHKMRRGDTRAKRDVWERRLGFWRRRPTARVNREFWKPSDIRWEGEDF